MIKLKALNVKEHNCSGCMGDAGLDEDCIETSYLAGVQGLPPCVVSREYQNIIYIEDKKDGNKNS